MKNELKSRERLKNQDTGGAWLLTVLAAEPVDGAEEAEVELRRPAEAGVLGADVGAHRGRRGAGDLPTAVPAGFIQLHRAAIA